MDMKTMLQEATKRAGENVQKKRRDLKDLEPGVAYLALQAETNPVAFMSLLRGLLPAKIDLDVSIMGKDVVELLQERRQQLQDLRDITPVESKEPTT